MVAVKITIFVVAALLLSSNTLAAPRPPVGDADDTVVTASNKTAAAIVISASATGPVDAITDDINLAISNKTVLVTTDGNLTKNDATRDINVANASFILVQPSTANATSAITHTNNTSSMHSAGPSTTLTNTSSACSQTSRSMQGLDLGRLFSTTHHQRSSTTTGGDADETGVLEDATAPSTHTWYLAATAAHNNTDNATDVESCTTKTFHYDPVAATLTFNKTTKYANKTEQTDLLTLKADPYTGNFIVENEKMTLTYAIIHTDYTDLVVATSCVEMKNTTVPTTMSSGFVLSRLAQNLDMNQLALAKAELAEVGLSRADVHNMNLTTCTTAGHTALNKTLTTTTTLQLDTGSSTSIVSQPVVAPADDDDDRKKR